MNKKRYFFQLLFIKILLPVIFIATFNMPGITYSQSCDRDGVCETGEDKNSCVYDCLVSTLKKDIKLHCPVYDTDTIVRYRLNGTKEEITNIDDVANFLISKLDFAVSGRVGGGSAGAAWAALSVGG